MLLLRIFRLRALLPCLLTLLATACNTSTPDSPAPDASGTHVLQPDEVKVSPLAEEGRGENYDFHIRYPEMPPEWTALNKALHDYAAQRKREFLDALTPATERAAGAPLAALDLEFDIARRTEVFVSVLARETMHSRTDAEPTIASFVLDVPNDKLLSIVDLFTTPDAALQALSDECRRQLEGRYEASLRENSSDGSTLAPQLKKMQEGVERGTVADAANFSVFLIDGIDSKAIGLTLIFTQTRLGAGSGGEQQVEVPAKVFYNVLKPEYRDAFFFDSKELQPGVR